MTTYLLHCPRCGERLDFALEDSSWWHETKCSCGAEIYVEGAPWRVVVRAIMDRLADKAVVEQERAHLLELILEENSRQKRAAPDPAKEKTP